MIKSKTLEYYDYFDMRNHIEKKFGIPERNVLNKGWSDPPETYTFDGKVIWPKNVNEYQDFWHFMLDYWGDEFQKGKPIYLNWEDVFVYAEQKNPNGWQAQIAKLYLNEFPDEYTVIVDWGNHE